MSMIDLRSDTVTKPSPEMRRAMAEAVVGDDVLGDDPTIKKMEAMAADLFGKDAAMYVPSGTMSNQVGLYAASNRGDEVLCESGAHILNYEAAAPAAISGLMVRPIDGERGILSAASVEKHIRPLNIHHPLTRIVALENTHNRAGGTIYPLETIKEISAVAQKYGLWRHLDGARIWNAHVATGVAFKEYASHFDSMSVCLSKGLGAPIGSILMGSGKFIERARRVRKMFGGGMRQVGILAAAGIYAMENNIERLAEDHKNARYLAEELVKINGITIDLVTVQSNIVIVDINPAVISIDDFMTGITSHDVHCIPIGPGRVRFVTHMDVSFEDCRTAIEVIRKVMER